jgi:Ca-activated chloride channel family protein
MTLRPLAVVLVAAVAVAAAAPASRAQEPPVFAVGTEVVNLTVTVYDDQDKLVTDLRREDFKVFDDGRQQQIAFFGRAHGPEPDQALALDLGLMVDTSQSMVEVLRLTQHAAVRFLDTIPRARNLLTIFFDEDIRISRYDSEAQQGLFERIHALESSGNTALYDAVTVYLSRIQGADGRQVLVIFTDGEDTFSDVSLAEVLELVRSSTVTVYPIAFSSIRLGSARDMRCRAVLRQIADISGGTVFEPHTSRDLGPIYDKLLDELGSQYVIGFVPDGGRKEGYRKLRVEVERQGVKVRHRPGYSPPLVALEARR